MRVTTITDGCGEWALRSSRRRGGRGPSTVRRKALALIGAATVACAPGPAGTTSTSSDRSAHSPLAAMTVTGGLCEYGPCAETFAVDTDGMWLVSEDGRAVVDGHLSPGQLGDLSAAVERSAIVAGPLPPFTGTCPTARDEPEIGYEFAVRGVVHRASTCRSLVPEDDPGALALISLRDQAITSR